MGTAGIVMLEVRWFGVVWCVIGEGFFVVEFGDLDGVLDQGP
jgi:hypothetical protein